MRAENPRAVDRERYLQRVFGITSDEYRAILKLQGGVCAICGREPGARRFCVDHDHKSGNVRGLLCFRCNYGLTWYHDQASRLQAAANYITKPPAYDVIGPRAVPPKPKRKRRARRGAAL